MHPNPAGEAHQAVIGRGSVSRLLRLFAYTFLTRGWPTWIRYVATAAIILSIFGLRHLIGTPVPGTPFLFLLLAIMICSALFDHGTGIFAVLLSAGLAKWFLIEPLGSLDVTRAEDIVGLAVFVAIGLVTAGIFEALHSVASDLARANERLSASESGKDLVLREASHRFMNELTMLTAMLRLQERAVRDDTARAALATTADRVSVLARLHERLQRSSDSAIIDMRVFFSDLCQDLETALIGARPIRLEVAAESHFLEQERAVPLGLIVNELLTNALKYAFPDEREGLVTVSFVADSGAFRLVVTDDGVGMAPDRAPRGSGLGQRLVRSMVLQLQGELAIGPDSGSPGTVATITFPAAPARPANPVR
jgi:two-component sensor histidine kinase